MKVLYFHQLNKQVCWSQHSFWLVANDHACWLLNDNYLGSSGPRSWANYICVLFKTLLLKDRLQKGHILYT
jgi:hypothetical protein